MSEEKIKLLIADDSKLTLVGLKTMFQAQKSIEVIDTAENGQEAVDKAQELHPDIILMDLGMPLLDGIQATKKIKVQNKDIKIIILTTHDREEEVLDALSAGANSYCMKEIPPNELVNVIESTYNGASWLDPQIANIVLTSINSSKKTKGSELTEREVEIIELISQGKTNVQISEDLFISMNTVKTHIKNIFAKLEVEDRTQAVMKSLEKDIL